MPCKPASPIELGQIPFVSNISCLYLTYIRGEAYLAAGQGKEAAAEFQKILDHSGIVWNCWTGALAHLGVARANALQARTSQGADADAARVRALAAYKDFLTLWKDADPDIPILSKPKPSTRSCNEGRASTGSTTFCCSIPNLKKHSGRKTLIHKFTHRERFPQSFSAAGSPLWQLRPS